MRLFLTLIAVLVCVSPATAGEVELVKKLAPKFKARAEVRLPDGTRADLLNAKYAFEADWSHKWAEAIGQSVHYGLMTGRKPAIILLVKDRKAEFNHIIRCRAVCHHLGIRLILVNVKDIEDAAE